METAKQRRKIFENSIHQHNVCSQFALLSVYCLGFYVFLEQSVDFLLAYKKRQPACAGRGVANHSRKQLKALAKQISGLSKFISRVVSLICWPACVLWLMTSFSIVCRSTIVHKSFKFSFFLLGFGARCGSKRNERKKRRTSRCVRRIS
jgi:hypothetical protein